MDTTTQRDLREIDQRIAALNISLTEQLADLNISLNARLGSIQADLDRHRWQTDYCHKAILLRLERLESRPDDKLSILSLIDPKFITKIVVWVVMAATGIITYAELGKLATN